LFWQAIELTRQQGALSYELRVSTSLARLLRDQGHCANTKALLQPVFSQFTEGFETSDLKASKALLDDLCWFPIEIGVVSHGAWALFRLGMVTAAWMGKLLSASVGYQRGGLQPFCSVSEPVRGDGLIYNFLRQTTRQISPNGACWWKDHHCPRLWIYMPSSHPSSNVPLTLPPLVAAFVEATNTFDLERLMVTFADDALVNDQLRDYWGKAAIRRWAERDIIGEGLTIAVTKVVNHYDNFIVTADIDGNFDKRGLPDPLVLAFYFTPHTDLIIQLIILRNRQDIWRLPNTPGFSNP
jgi:hypothetical protein